jgi:hypothetical protein
VLLQTHRHLHPSWSWRFAQTLKVDLETNTTRTKDMSIKRLIRSTHAPKMAQDASQTTADMDKIARADHIQCNRPTLPRLGCNGPQKGREHQVCKLYERRTNNDRYGSKAASGSSPVPNKGLQTDLSQPATGCNSGVKEKADTTQWPAPPSQTIPHNSEQIWQEEKK